MDRHYLQPELTWGWKGGAAASGLGCSRQVLGYSPGLLAKSQISLATCCSHWYSTCVTCNLGACPCPMCPHSSVPLDCATLVTRIPTSSFLLLLLVSYVILAGNSENLMQNEIKFKKTKWKQAWSLCGWEVLVCS